MPNFATRLVSMSDAKHAGAESDTDRIIDGLHRVDEHVDRLRNQRLNDPDSLGDKLFSKRNLRRGRAADAPQSLMLSLAFAAISAAFGAVVSQLSDRGSKAFVNRRHRNNGSR